MQVLPAIIEDTYEEVEKKLKLVAPLVDWVQVDIGDGAFVPHETWTRIEDLAQAPPSLKIDLHIMVEDVRGFARRAAALSSIARITFHYEATADIHGVIEEIKRSTRAVGLALNPETSVDAVRDCLSSIDAALLMGVHPGFGGQDFIKETPARIRAVKDLCLRTSVKIGVDGGMHLASGSAQEAVDAGVDYLVVGSGILKTSDPAEAIKQFQSISPHRS